jgi:hypothetical protein
VNTGYGNIPPRQIFDVVPPGTAIVSGTWIGYFYSSSGQLLCVVTSGSNPCQGQQPPDTGNGGTIRVTFLVTGASVGDNLTETYTIAVGPDQATDSISFTVS